MWRTPFLNMMSVRAAQSNLPGCPHLSPTWSPPESAEDSPHPLRTHRYARHKGIYLTASGWDEGSVDFLVDELRVPFLKMASADLTNFPLLEHAAAKKVPVILSTGDEGKPKLLAYSCLIQKQSSS